MRVKGVPYIEHLLLRIASNTFLTVKFIDKLLENATPELKGAIFNSFENVLNQVTQNTPGKEKEKPKEGDRFSHAIDLNAEDES